MLNERVRAWVVTPLMIVTFVCGVVTPSFATIHAGDSIYVKVWNHPELSKQVAVDAAGNVRVPLSGIVAVGGLEESEAGKKLAFALRNFISYPAVDVQTVEQGKFVFVSGGPGGVLKYQPGESLAAAISDAMQSSPEPTQSLNDAGQSISRVDSSAVALRARVDLQRVGLQRDGKSIGTFNAVQFGTQGDPGPLLEPGDTIVFNYKPIQVQVTGDVAHPGIAYLSPEQSVSEAITQVGGLLPTASSNHVSLSRAGSVRLLALGDPAFRAPAQMGDIISVPSAPRVNVVGTVVTPGVVTLKTDSSLLSAMYAAGGPTRFANLKDVSVVSATGTKTYDVTLLTHGDLDENPILHDGDTVVVPEGHKIDFTTFFAILGGVAAGLAGRI